MAEVNEEKRSDDIHDNDPVLEKSQSPQQHVEPASGTPSDEESDINGERRFSEDALGELIPQLTRRGTINHDSPAFSTEKYLREIISRANAQGLRRRNAGVVFRSLVVLGYGSDFTHQKTVGTMATGIARLPQTIRTRRHPPMKTILYSMDGVVKEGEMLLVLGKPGSGATTLLKTIAGDTRSYASVSGGFLLNHFQFSDSIDIHYNGIPAKVMHDRFRGEVAYNGEVDVHFPHLTVGQTLTFAAKLRTPHTRVDNMPRKTMVESIVKILGSVFGLRHTFNTKVGVRAP